MLTTIEQLLALTVTDLKRLGFLRPNDVHRGAVEWKRADGTRRASIYVETDLRFEIPSVRLVYDHGGKTLDYTTLLRWKQSNLNNGGFYYFVCPVTGRSCRKLYLVGGRFVSRYAFRALYDKQLWSKSDRADPLNDLVAFAEWEQLAGQRYRKPVYRGKLTPYGRKLEKYDRNAERLASLYEQELADGKKPA